MKTAKDVEVERGTDIRSYHFSVIIKYYMKSENPVIKKRKLKHTLLTPLKL